VPFVVFEGMYLKPAERREIIAWFRQRGYVPSSSGFFKPEPDMVDSQFGEMIYLTLTS
jgi:hypothetical protein